MLQSIRCRLYINLNGIQIAEDPRLIHASGSNRSSRTDVGGNDPIHCSSHISARLGMDRRWPQTVTVTRMKVAGIKVPVAPFLFRA
jgi:hypothetical protein